MTTWKMQAKRLAQLGLLAYVVDGVVRKGWMRGKPKVLFKKEDEKMKRILDRMDTLRGRYWPTCYAHTPYAQFVVFILHKLINWNALSYERHLVDADDGGRVAVDIFQEPRGMAKLPDDAPVLLILHTITGTVNDEMELAKRAFAQGWRPIHMSRRGHFEDLQVPKFNLMGCVEDSKRMIAFVHKRYPKSFIGACGISAGSGQVVSYIGNQADAFPVHAAVSLCPAYCLRTAFDNFDRRSPWLAQYLLFGLKFFFLKKNASLLEGTKGYEECLSASTVQEFFLSHVHMAGFNDFEAYLEASNPMEHYQRSKIPCLILNALDDPLCVEENIRYDIATETENYALVTTEAGSHVAYREGLFAESSYMHRVALDFLESARHEWETENAKQ